MQRLIAVFVLVLLAVPGQLEAQSVKSRRLNTQGYRLYRLGKLAQARAKFKLALREDATNLLAGYNLACALCRLGKLDQAELMLHFVLRGDAKGKFSAQMMTDADLKALREKGAIKPIIVRAGLSGTDHALITRAIATGKPNHDPSGKTPVLTTDLNGDKELEAFWWVDNSSLSLDTQLIAVTRRAGGLKVSPLRTLPSFVDSGSLLAAGKGLGLLVSSFSSSHNSIESYTLVRVDKGVVTTAWDHGTSLESTCLQDNCTGHTDSNDQIDFTLINLDKDPTQELVVTETSDCVLRAAKVKVLKLRKGKMKPMRGGRRVLARRVAALRPLILKGDNKALEQLFHLCPADFKTLRRMIWALRGARKGSPQEAVLDDLISRFARSASKRALRRLRTDPRLKKKLTDYPDPSASCTAEYTGQSY